MRSILGEIISGPSFIFGISGAALGPLPFAASIDWMDSYSAALIGSFVLCIACGAASFVIGQPGPQVVASHPN